MTGKTGRGMRPWLGLAQGSADLIQGLGPQRGAWTLYKADVVVQYTILEEPSSARRPWVGRTDAEQEENWESDKKRVTPVKALLLPSTILYFYQLVFLPSCISAILHFCYLMPTIHIS